MSFDEVLLPNDIAGNARGGPMYSTIVVTTSAGAEQRISLWSGGRLKWDLSGHEYDLSTMNTLIAFFRARGGKARGFRMRDWTDYMAAAEPLANPGTTSLQLIKTYTSGSVSEVRTITKPVSGTVMLTKNGTPQVLGTDYTLDITTGIITLASSAGGASFAWTGQFDVPVRFDTDEMQFQYDQFSYRSWQSIPVVELLAAQ